MDSVTQWMSGTTVKPVAGSFLSGVLLVVTAFRQWRRNVLVHYKMERAKFIHKPHRYQSLEGLFGLPRVVLNYLSQIFWPLTIVVSTLCIFVCLPSHIQCHTCIEWNCDHYGSKRHKHLSMLLASAFTECLWSSFSWETLSSTGATIPAVGILLEAKANLRPSSNPLRSSADDCLEERFMTHLSFGDEPELIRDLLLRKWRSFSVVFLTLFDKRLLFFRTVELLDPRGFGVVYQSTEFTEWTIEKRSKWM